MPVFQAKQLEALLVDIFVAAGSPLDIAQYVSASLVDSSLKGVDSHGVMRVSLYVNQIASWPSSQSSGWHPQLTHLGDGSRRKEHMP